MLVSFTPVQVKIWDPSLRGSELRATLKGHSGSLSAPLSFRHSYKSISSYLIVVFNADCSFSDFILFAELFVP